MLQLVSQLSLGLCWEVNPLSNMIMNEYLNHFVTVACKAMCSPALTARGIAVQWVFHIYNEGVKSHLVKRQVDMVGIERYRHISPVNVNVLSVGCEHMKITAQSNVTLRGRNVLPFNDALPLTVLYPILSFKSHLRYQSRRGLQARAVIKPYQNSGKQN